MQAFPQSVGIGKMPPLEAHPPLETVADSLEQHASSRRIKKLVFGTCQNSWENDPAILAKFELRELLKTLINRYPTLDALKQAVGRTVASLNRQQIYEEVAEVIISQAESFYASQSDHSTATALLTHDATQLEARLDTGSYEAIAQTVKQSSQQLRLTKLLYCIAHDAWENNPQTLAQVNLIALIEQVHQLVPTAKDLKYRLGRIIQQLNHQNEYRSVADILLKAFRVLYQQSQPDLSCLERVDLAEKATSTQLEPLLSPVVGGATRLACDSLRVIKNEAEPAYLIAGPRDRSNLFRYAWKF
ncbi:MAG: hypothetical protein HC873_19240 [Leptolyngbyaceae cyanobacterium SL_1_1]|nr:hypothetical protein [Leptolyngbyaceae cyanobacterium SL_1_1]